MQHLKILLATGEGTKRGREGEIEGRDKGGETALTEQHKEAMRQKRQNE